MKEMPVSYHRILMRLEQKEQRMLRRSSPAPLSVPMEKLRSRIPYAVQYNLELAFAKAFSLLFSPEGKRFLEHTYARRSLEESARHWESPLSPGQARKALSRLNRSAGVSAAVDNTAAGVEGAVLGLLGIGLPDIPVLLAWLLRSLYQNATRYGIPCNSPAEQVYLLLLLQGALTDGDTRRSFSQRADRLGRALDHNWPVEYDLDTEMHAAALLLSDRLLLIKFIQGLPIVGIVGGASNLPLSGAVTRYGTTKYKKRFLERKVRGL